MDTTPPPIIMARLYRVHRKLQGEAAKIQRSHIPAPDKRRQVDMVREELTAMEAVLVMVDSIHKGDATLVHKSAETRLHPDVIEGS